MLLTVRRLGNLETPIFIFITYRWHHNLFDIHPLFDKFLVLHRSQLHPTNLFTLISKLEKYISTLTVESQILAMNVHSRLPIANSPSDNKY